MPTYTATFEATTDNAATFIELSYTICADDIEDAFEQAIQLLNEGEGEGEGEEVGIRAMTIQQVGEHA